MPGLFIGQSTMSIPGIIDVGEPENTGDRTIRMIAARKPAVHAPHRATGVEPAPEQRVQDGRQIRRRRDGERQRDEEGDVLPLRTDAADDRQDADHDHRATCDAHLAVRIGLDRRSRRILPALLDHVRVDVVRERRGRRDRESGDDREDRGERDRRDEPEQHGSAEVRARAAAPPSSAHREPPR